MQSLPTKVGLVRCINEWLHAACGGLCLDRTTEPRRFPGRLGKLVEPAHHV